MNFSIAVTKDYHAINCDSPQVLVAEAKHFF